MFEEKIDINQILEIRCRTTLYFGCGAIKKIFDITSTLKNNRNINKILIVTGQSSYKTSGAWEYIKTALEENCISYLIYDKVQPNPTTDMIDEAVKEGKKFGAEAIIGIGGGSPIDTAKSAAILLKHTDKTASELYQGQFIPSNAVPVIAINLTHGTGTEVNRFAVATISEKNFKPVIAYDCIYPLYAIDDPALMTSLSADQSRFVSIDAINHVTEAATSTAASPYTIILGKETIRLVAKYLPAVLKDPYDKTARYHLLYASALAGIAFDNGLLHFTHALEHPISAIKPEVAHGLGLTVLLPAVVRAVYPYKPEVLAELYEPIIPNLKGMVYETDLVAKKLEEWLFSIGITKKLSNLGISNEDIDNLIKLAFDTPVLSMLISMAPVPENLRVKTVREIYEKSLAPIS